MSEQVEPSSPPAHVVQLSPSTPVSMAESWYEFATPDHFWMKWRTILLRRMLERTHVDKGRGLDIGCGQGVLFRELEELHSVTIDGCDLNVAALEMAFPGRGTVYQYNVFDYHPDLVGSYDFTMLIDVIEHVEDDAAFLQAAARHVKPGGVVIVNVPALSMLYGPYDKAAGHLRRYSSASLKQALEKAGLVPERVAYWGFSMIPLLIVRNLVLRRTPEDEIIRRGFQPVHPFVNRALGWMRSIELGLGLTWPIGSSLTAIARVPSRS
ncbi:MAG: class I SAM-dependent methyltransferase [Candidatus Binatia bacterium]